MVFTNVFDLLNFYLAIPTMTISPLNQLISFLRTPFYKNLPLIFIENKTFWLINVIKKFHQNDNILIRNLSLLNIFLIIAFLIGRSSLIFAGFYWPTYSFVSILCIFIFLSTTVPLAL